MNGALRGISALLVLASFTTACTVDAPPPQGLVPALPRVDCGTVEPRASVGCRDVDAGDDYLERIFAPEPLREGAPLAVQLLAGACSSGEDPGRRLRAEVGATCERLAAEPPDSLQQRISLSATVERVCSRLGESTASAAPRWQGTIVLPPFAPPYTLAMVSESSLEETTRCLLQIAGTSQPIPVGTRSLIPVVLTESAAITLDCGASTLGLADLSCFQTPENAARPQATSSNRVVLTLGLTAGR